MKTVVAFGTFDIIHPGHLSYLEQAKRHGDVLIAVVTPDAAVLRRKGRRALFTQGERMKIVAAVRSVDRVVLGDQDDSWRNVLACRPDIICFGYDQKQAARALACRMQKGSKKPVRIVMARSYRARRYHSAYLIKNRHA
ncbi:adenylyltransferase/cytidyltransferase family protein [Candidatus Uhrbacteria bacterium]|nr:adenylyltransferase/cytidyltransferase family protein [Candidatus Uhrbacteria bacterium]